MKEADRDAGFVGALAGRGAIRRSCATLDPRSRGGADSGDLGGALAAAAAEGASPDAMTAVRRERTAAALALGLGDLAGLLPLEQVVAPLSELAGRALARSLAAAFAERTPDEAAQGFAIIALGKLGGHELNYSSDVDLIFLYDPKKLPRKPREEADQAALRIGQRVVEILQKRTDEGYGFRVDLRLRPSPEVTPIALPVDAAISYYESSALPWERAAFIRARAVAGDAALGRYFLDAIHPFVWRRSLDFGAIAELRSITRRIRDHYAQGQAFGPGYDVKRGRRGIREVVTSTTSLIAAAASPAALAATPTRSPRRRAGRIKATTARRAAAAGSCARSNTSDGGRR